MKTWGDFVFTAEQGRDWENLCSKSVQELAAIIVIRDNGCKKCAAKDAKIEKYKKAMIANNEALKAQRKKIDDMSEYMRSRRCYYEYLNISKGRR